MARSYTDQQVAEGRALVKKGAEAYLDLGRLGQDVCPLSSDGSHDGTESLRESFAATIGLSSEQLRQYQWVHITWKPSATRVADEGLAYSVLRELAPLANDQGLDAAWAKIEQAQQDHPYGRATVDGVRRATGRVPTNTGKLADRQEANDTLPTDVYETDEQGRWQADKPAQALAEVLERRPDRIYDLAYQRPDLVDELAKACCGTSRIGRSG